MSSCEHDWGRDGWENQVKVTTDNGKLVVPKITAKNLKRGYRCYKCGAIKYENGDYEEQIGI